ncbi:MAG TPA: hypothetical protein VGN42_09165 [Pirellulales bacterium]|jgi:hypothetical protein|nr:hypothetical protein [Pirellulales bacterium]
MSEWLAEGFRATGMLQRLPEDCARRPALIDELLDGARAARNPEANAGRHDDLDAAAGRFAKFLLFE